MEAVEVKHSKELEVPEVMAVIMVEVEAVGHTVSEVEEPVQCLTAKVQ